MVPPKDHEPVIVELERPVAGGVVLGRDAEGRVVAPPRVVDAPLTARALTHVYLSKGSDQELEIHRIALARSAHEALSPMGERGPMASSSPIAASDVPLRDEDRIVFLNPRRALQWGPGVGARESEDRIEIGRASCRERVYREV